MKSNTKRNRVVVGASSEIRLQINASQFARKLVKTTVFVRDPISVPVLLIGKGTAVKQMSMNAKTRHVHMNVRISFLAFSVPVE